MLVPATFPLARWLVVGISGFPVLPTTGTNFCDITHSFAVSNFSTDIATDPFAADRRREGRLGRHPPYVLGDHARRLVNTYFVGC